MFKGVLFDLDGVITDTAEYHYLAWRALAAELGIEIDRQFNQQLKGLSRADSLRLILQKGQQTELYQGDAFQELMQQKNENYLKMIQKITPDDILPGIKELLFELQAANIKIALASASQNGPVILEKLGLADCFLGIADPKQVAAGKPAPDIYLLAAKEIGLNAQECLGIEDALAGIQAIQASGAVPVGVGKAQDLGADIDIVETTKDLNLAYLQEVWQKCEK